MEPVRCPSCGTEMLPHPTPMQRLDCPSCGTVCFPRDHLEGIARGLSDRIEYEPSPEQCGIMICRDCPTCDTPMRKTALLHRPSWLMDYCDHCGVFYLGSRDFAEMQGNLPDRHTGEYHLGGFNIRLERFLVTSYMDSVPYLRVTVRFRRPLGLGLRLYSEKWTDHLMNLIGWHGRSAVFTGNRRFDDRFIISGRETAWIRDRFFVPEMQGALLDFVNRYRFHQSVPSLEMVDSWFSAVEGPVPIESFYDPASDPQGSVRAMIAIAELAERLAPEPGPDGAHPA